MSLHTRKKPVALAVTPTGGDVRALGLALLVLVLIIASIPGAVTAPAL